MEQEISVSRCELLYTEGVNNKILLYSIENQCPMINIMEKYMKKNVDVCITESL